MFGADSNGLAVIDAISAATASPKPAGVLGIDDFATRRGYRYGTILVDVVTHRPVDLLPDREASTVAGWLRQHPEVQVICRDRDGGYAKGARDGAPRAIQVADRFHLWANLGQAVEKTVTAHRCCLAEPEPDPHPSPDAGPGDNTAVAAEHPAAEQVPDQDPHVDSGESVLAHTDGFLDVCGRPRRLTQRHTERFEAIQNLRAQGMSIRVISHQLALDRKPVRRFADAAGLQELMFKATHRVSKLDTFKRYLDHRVSQGCTNAVTLFAELKTLGFSGSDQTVRRYLAPFRIKSSNPSKPTAAKTPAGRPAPPKPRRVASWIMTDPAHLSPGNATQLKQILARCPELDALTRHVAGFATMICKLRGDQLDQWMTAAAADDLPALHSMIHGMRRDLDAVTAGLTRPYSSGVVEGHIT